MTDNLYKYGGLNTVEAKKTHMTKSQSEEFSQDIKKSISDNLEKESKGRFIRLLSESLEANSIRKEFLNFLSEDHVYIAKIPKKVQEELDNNLIKFMTDKKTGENLSVLVDQKNRIKSHMNVEKVQNNFDITRQISSIAVQRQLAEMAEVLGDVRNRVIALQVAHDNDLFGSIKGMEEQMRQIMNTEDDDTRKSLICNAITVLNETCGKITSSLIWTIKSLPNVPDNDLKTIAEILRDKGFLPSVVENYDRAEELLCYYLTASQLLAFCYAYLGEERAYEDTFKSISKLTDKGSIQKFVLAERVFEETVAEAWYKSADKYMLKVNNMAHDLFSTEGKEYIMFEISGLELLEELSYVSE